MMLDYCVFTGLKNITQFFMEIFFFIEKLKTWVHQIKPISGGKKSKPTIEKKVNTVWAISEPREYIL